MGVVDGKVVLVTGAGGGIGRQHALALARQGARVVVNDLGGTRDGMGGGSEMADQVVADIRSSGGEAVASYDSVTEPEGCARMVSLACEAWGRLDAVVNNAGILRDRTFSRMSDEEWEAVLAVHLAGTRNVVRAALPELRAHGGAIVNTTSFSGMIGNFGQANYAAAKAAIYGLTRVLAMELGKYGVTANCVAPVAKTRMTDEISMVQSSWTAEQISPLVVYLCSDLAREVTGRVFGVQGQRLHLYEVKVNAGVVKPGRAPWNPREIAEQMDGITSWDQELDVADLWKPEDEPTPRWPIGKRYDSGTWVVESDEVEGYALATNDLNPRYRGPDAVAPPMYHVVPFFRLMIQCASDPELGIDMLRLVHGEHHMTFARTVRPGERIELSGELLSVEDKGSGRVFTFDFFGDIAGERVFSGGTSYFIRNKKKKPAKGGTRPAPPTPPPVDLLITQAVAEDQASRYAEASGDRNPIHLDPETARSSGLPGVILHGLCTMAFATRDLIDHLADGEPSRLAGIGVRFAHPVFPGEELTLSVWGTEGDVDFVTHNAAGKAVMTRGRAEIRPA